MDISAAFDDTNRNWISPPELRGIFFRAQENYFNDLLRARGFVFLNDIYDSLGIKRTPEGQLVGWFNEPLSRAIKISYIQFEDRDRLTFNPDGIIVHKI